MSCAVRPYMTTATDARPCRPQRCPVTVDLPFCHWILPNLRLRPLNIARPAVMMGVRAGEGHARGAIFPGGADAHRLFRPRRAGRSSRALAIQDSSVQVRRSRRGRSSVTGQEDRARLTSVGRCPRLVGALPAGRASGRRESEAQSSLGFGFCRRHRDLLVQHQQFGVLRGPKNGRGCPGTGGCSASGGPILIPAAGRPIMPGSRQIVQILQASVIRSFSRCSRAARSQFGSLARSWLSVTLLAAYADFLTGKGSLPAAPLSCGPQ